MPAISDLPAKKSYKALKTSFFVRSSDAEKYFVIGGDTIKNLDIFDIHEGLELISKDDFKNCTILGSGDVLVQTKNAQQIETLKSTTVFGTDKLPVSISENGVLNTSQCLIRCKHLMKVEIEKITEKLAGQKVTKVERMRKNENNTWVDTPTHLLTFNTPVCPAEVRVGFIHLKTELYIPAPFRCVLCQRLGHTKKKCGENTKRVCGFCAQDYHGIEKCTQPAKCVNCEENHPSFSKQCPKYVAEKEINAIRVSMRIPYNLARAEYRKRIGVPISRQNAPVSRQVSNSNTSSTSYAQIVRSTTSGTLPTRSAPSLDTTAAKLSSPSPPLPMETSTSARDTEVDIQQSSSSTVQVKSKHVTRSPKDDKITKKSFKRMKTNEKIENSNQTILTEISNSLEIPKSPNAKEILPMAISLSNYSQSEENSSPKLEQTQAYTLTNSSNGETSLPDGKATFSRSSSPIPPPNPNPPHPPKPPDPSFSSKLSSLDETDSIENTSDIDMTNDDDEFS